MQGRNKNFIPGVFSPVDFFFVSFLFPSFPLSSLEVPVKSSYGIWGTALSSPSRRERTTFTTTSHVPWALNTPNAFAALRWPQTHLVYYIEPRKRFWWL